MAKYKPYPAYKDSGVEWTGSIPRHWKMKRNIGLYSERIEIDHPDEELLAVTIKHGVLKQSELADLTDRKNTASDDKTRYKLVHVGDIAYNKMRMWQGAIGVSPDRGIVSPAYVVLKPEPKTNSRFFYYQYKTPGFICESGRFSYGLCDDMNSLRYKDFRGLQSVAPPPEEQAQIAAFLDHETAKIDRLIEKQEELIELLKEKRQAVISLAVTKGLDPDAPMKDSGVEWLGKIPAHWEVKQLGFLSSCMQTGPFGSQLHAEDYIENGTPIVNPAHMVNGEIIPESKCCVDEVTAERLGQHRLRLNDLIFARRGELGRCALVTENEVGWLCGTGSLKASLHTKIIDPRYALLYVQTQAVKDALTLESKGSTMANLNTEILSKLRIPLPHKREQLAIVCYIEESHKLLNNVLHKAEQGIALLQERRTALISAAVTGKIDVREWQPEQAS